MVDDSRLEIGPFIVRAGYSVNITCTAKSDSYQRAWLYLKPHASATSSEATEFVGGGKDNGSQENMKRSTDNTGLSWRISPARATRYLYVAIQYSADNKDDTWKNSLIAGPAVVEIENMVIGIFSSANQAGDSFDHCIVRVVASALCSPSEILPNLSLKYTIHRTAPANFILTAPITHGTSAEVTNISLGSLVSTVSTVLQLTREKLWWLQPRVSKSRSLSSNVDTQLLLLQLSSDHAFNVAAVLPLTEPAYMGTLRGSNDGLVARYERDVISGGKEDVRVKLIITFGSSVNDAVRNAVDTARIAAGIATVPNVLDPEQHLFTDHLTYCTWNSLPSSSYTTTAIVTTLTHFSSLSIHPSTLLIDDGWQDVEDSKLQSFDAKHSFLDGMKDLGVLVTKVKTDHQISSVGVWHTIGAYWHGVEPAKFKDNYKLVKITKDGYPGPWEPKGYTYYIPHPSDVGRFFSDYYAKLASFGISHTKCDNMASLDSIASASTFTTSSQDIEESVDVPSLRVAYKNAVKAAALKHFGGADKGKVIWCMEMSPRVLLGREIGFHSGGTRYVCRNSDDYFPTTLDQYPNHIFSNAINATFTSRLNVIPDFDMFQSKPDSTTQGLGAYHAAFRAFGAGPVTITDTASRTDTGVTNKLLGKAPGSNHSIALQARSSPWVSEAVFDTNLLGSGTGRALRIFSRDSAPGVHGGMVGYWNVRKDNGKVEDSISLDDIREVVAVSPYTKLGKYAIWSHTKSKLFVADFTASTPSISPSTTSDLSISLAPFSFEIVTISAIDNGIAALGLIDKYNPLGGIISHHWEENFHQLEMKSFGRVGFFADAMPPPFVEVGGRFVQCELIAEDSGYLLALDLDETYEDLTITLYHRR